jgi:hypothetical protein
MAVAMAAVGGDVGVDEGVGVRVTSTSAPTMTNRTTRAIKAARVCELI